MINQAILEALIAIIHRMIRWWAHKLEERLEAKERVNKNEYEL